MSNMYGTQGYIRNQGSFHNLASYHRIPSHRQHPIKGAYAASVMNDHADVMYHVKQSFRNGVSAGFKRSRMGSRGYSSGYRGFQYTARRYGGQRYTQQRGFYGRPTFYGRSQYNRGSSYRRY